MELQPPEISVVTPVCNEESVIKEFYYQVTGVLKKCSVNYEIVFIDDGSEDRTFEILKECRQIAQGRVRIVRLSRNFGHQLAITAGERHAKGRAVVVMDGDLQDPPEMIQRFIEKWREGFDIVYGVRSDRQGETLFKRWTASFFYWLMEKVAEVDIPSNVGDFYLLDRKVVNVLNSMDERHRFIRGLVAWMGFRRAGLPYVRRPRFGGYTKYDLFKMIKFSFDALTSFSFVPLRFISMLGALISLLAFTGIMMVFIIKVFNPHVVLGWSSIMVVVLFMGGIQLLAIGVIGEYLARIGDDVKKRPLYIVQETLE
ncbi:MAG: glycosyltransferase family 2 protein [Candidatus Omnitrophota bacterium]